MKITAPNITPGDWHAIKGDTLNQDRSWGISRYFTMEQNREIDGDDAEPNSRTEVIAEVMGGTKEIEEADAKMLAAAPKLAAALESALARLEHYIPEEAKGYAQGCFKYVAGGFDMWDCDCPICAARSALLAAGYTFTDS